jgi:hypothetical protein
MKPGFLLLTLTIALSGISYSQSPKDGISDLIVRYRNIDDDMTPVSTTDPAHQNRKVIMEITFTVDNPDNLKEIEIKGAETETANFFADSKFVASEVNSKNQLEYNGKSFVIEGNKVSIEQEIPESLLTKKRSITVRSINKSNVVTATLTKSNN